MQPPPFPMGGAPAPPPPFMGMPFGMDPTWALPPGQGFNWWEYATKKVHEPKILRVAYNIASMLVKDRISEEKMKELSGARIKFFDYSLDGELAPFFESLGVKVDTVKPHEGTFMLMSTSLQANQIIVIHGLVIPQPKEVYNTLYKFVSEGGRLICIGCAPQILTNSFGKSFQSLPHSTTVKARMKVQSQQDLFSGYPNPADLSLELSRYPMLNNDNSVETLTVVESNHGNEPLLVKFNEGSGVVYHLVSKLFSVEKSLEELAKELIHAHGEPSLEELPTPVKEKKQTILAYKEQEEKEKAKNAPEEEENSGNNSEAMEEGELNNLTHKQQKKRRRQQQPKKKSKRELYHEREKHFEVFSKYLKDRGASNETIASWYCVSNIGYTDAFTLAVQALGSMELLAKILLIEHAIVKTHTEQLEMQQQNEENTQQGNQPQEGQTETAQPMTDQ